ncbi:MAG: TIGR02186 family protein [Pseudomonadota bacterium]
MRAFLLLLALALPARAEEVVGALSQNTVSITANFNGSEIWVFGAVKREEPVPEGSPPLGVVITVQGPDERVTVRKKARTLGIWVNRDAVEVDVAPSFYAIATTAPLDDVISATERLRHRIGFDQAVRLVGAPAGIDMPRDFARAITRIRQDNGLYVQNDGSVDLNAETLFTTRVTLPANLVEGTYVARMFLTRDRRVVSTTDVDIDVRKEGLERLIYTTAHERPFLYGVLSLAIALFAGWAASEVFRLLRR